MTALNNRSEPIFYLSILGHQVVQGGLDNKLTQLKYGFGGQIQDGLLFHASSISRDAKAVGPLQSWVQALLFAYLPGCSVLRCRCWLSPRVLAFAAGRPGDNDLIPRCTR